jgi:hypothetical protein
LDTLQKEALFCFCRRALLAPTLVTRSIAHMGATKDFPLSPMREKQNYVLASDAQHMSP